MDEKFDIEDFPTSESAKRMLGYVSDGFYDESYVGKWLFQVMGLEYDSARELAENLPYQFFPETATWGLMYHEQKWGLAVRKNLPYKERRRLIYQKRDLKAPMTPYKMEIYLEQATGFKVKIADIHEPGNYGFVPPHPNVFKAYFLGEGTLDVSAVRKILDSLKQSHTVYRINDRIESVLDNSNLEKMMLWNIRLHMRAGFWDCGIFDGYLKFDGTFVFCQKRRYRLLPGLKCRMGIDCKEGAKVPLLKTLTGVNVRETVYTGLQYRVSIDFWNRCYFNGEWMFDGSRSFNSSRGRLKTSIKVHIGIKTVTECIGNMEIIVKRNPHFFDGSVRFDGTVIANAVYRRETVE